MVQQFLPKMQLNLEKTSVNTPQHTFEVRMLNITVSVIILGCIVMMIFMILDPPRGGFPWLIVNILSGVIIFQGLIYRLSKTGYLQLAIQTDIIFLCIILIYGAFESGGLYASATIIFFIPLVLSATILTIRFTILVAIIMIISFGGLYLIEVLGYLPYAPLKDLPYRMIILTGSTIVLTSVFAQYRRVLNITENHRIQLETTAERLRTQQQLTQDLAHDLRTPITVVQNSLYLIKRKEELGHDTETNYLALESNVSKLKLMVEGFIELSKLDSSIEEDVTTLQLVELEPIIDQLFSGFYDFAQQYDVELHKEIQSNVSVMGRPNQLTRVFENLISNAIYYGRDGKQIIVKISKSKTTAIISIVDYGQGIAPDEQSKIFERFYRVNDARTSTEHVGSGIGLSIVKRIVEAYGGYIEVESSLGVGSKFTIYLPLPIVDN